MKSRPPERVYTKPLGDKLGIGIGMRVAVVGVDDPVLERILADRDADVTHGMPEPGTNLVFLAADSPADLDLLGALRPRLVSDGAVWVVSRKGKAATLRDVEVIAAGIANGFIDNKVVAFSETHTSIRLVIPRAMRAAHAAETSATGGRG